MEKKKLSVVELFGIIIVALLISFFGVRFLISNNNSNVHESPFSHLGGEFTLDSVNGKVSRSDYKGQYLILYFGFTFCPDVCPLSLSNLSKLLKTVPDFRKESQVLFVSVDHKRDTPESANTYAKHFDSSFIGVTAKKEVLDKVVKSFAAAYEYEEMPDSEIKFTVNHTSRFYIMNKVGTLMAIVDDTIEPDKFKKIINKIK